MKKFKFRLDRLLRQRKAELDMAQKVYYEAQVKVQEQLALIQSQYKDLDSARERIEQLEKQGGNFILQVETLHSFITGQKIRIENSRAKARELMLVAEEKHEALIEKMQAHKMIERLKEKKKEEHKIEMRKKLAKQLDDITLMRTHMARKVV